MAYIPDLMSRSVEPLPDRISVERYVLESSYITRYLSRVVKDKALAIYHVLFLLSWFETGKGEIVIPWEQVGKFVRSEQGNIIDNSRTVKRRLADLFKNKCIAVNRRRGGANEISVHLPSDIEACRRLIDREERPIAAQAEEIDERDWYNDPGRRLTILTRDGEICVYCRAPLSKDTFVLDHLLPVATGGTNRKHNLVAACELCNRRRGELDPIQFLRENYRQQLLSQEEFLGQKEYIEGLLARFTSLSVGTS